MTRAPFVKLPSKLPTHDVKEFTRLSLPVYLGVLGALSAALMLWITPFGAGVSPDSTVYLAGARNILLGHGYYAGGAPIVHYPPLYSAALAAVGLLQPNLVQAARILNAILYGLNVVLIMLAVYVSTRRSLLAASCAALTFWSSAEFAELHAMAWSEPLFLFWTLVGITLLCLCASDAALLPLTMSALSFGLAALTRYIGAAFLPGALCVVVLASRNQPIRRQALHGLLWIVLSCGPLAAYLARNAVIGGSPTGRTLAMHPVPAPAFFADLFRTVMDFIAPGSWPAGIRPLLFASVAVFLLVHVAILWKRQWHQLDWHSTALLTTAVSLAFSLCYVSFLLISMSFFDAATPLDFRLLSPVFAVLTPSAFAGIYFLSARLQMRALWPCFLGLVILALLPRTARAVVVEADIQANGLMYTSRQWTTSKTMAFLESLPQSTRVYSNGRDVVGFWTNLDSLSIPAKTDSVSLLPNPQFDSQLKMMCIEITEHRALLIYFDAITWRWYLPTEAELESRCNLPLAAQFSDGVVYGTVTR